MKNLQKPAFEPLETQRLILRNWNEQDEELFHLINSDPQVMKFFPFTRDRQQSDEFLKTIKQKIDENQFGFCAVELKQSNLCIGFVGLNGFNHPATPEKTDIEIGWRLAPQFWGHGYASEAASRWLEYGFNKLKLNEIISFAVTQNNASFKVMERIGMNPYKTRDFDHPNVPDTHPHLIRHILYSIKKNDWLNRNI